jgi:hypothetical protein
VCSAAWGGSPGTVHLNRKFRHHARAPTSEENRGETRKESARAAPCCARSLPDSLPDFRKGALARIFCPKKIFINTTQSHPRCGVYTWVGCKEAWVHEGGRGGVGTGATDQHAAARQIKGGYARASRELTAFWRPLEPCAKSERARCRGAAALHPDVRQARAAL